MKNTRRPLWRDLCWGVAASVTSALLFALDSGSFRTMRHDFLLALGIEAPMAVMANLLDTVLVVKPLLRSPARLLRRKACQT